MTIAVCDTCNGMDEGDCDAHKSLMDTRNHWMDGEWTQQSLFGHTVLSSLHLCLVASLPPLSLPFSFSLFHFTVSLYFVLSHSSHFECEDFSSHDCASGGGKKWVKEKRKKRKEPLMLDDSQSMDG